MAIAVEVPHRHRDGIAPEEVPDLGLKSPVAVALQVTHPGVNLTGHGEVELAVAVEIPHRYGIGRVANGVILAGFEGAVAVAQQDTHHATIPKQTIVAGHGKV